MWLPSLWAVLADLWRFVWRRDEPRSTAVQQLLADSATPPAQPALITLDTQRTATARLHTGTLYTAASAQTLQIRQQLMQHDPQLAQTGNLSIIEWLLYAIAIQTNSVSLLALRMSPLGRWHQTVKGLSDVRVEVEPTTGALMEWTDQEHIGHAGLVVRLAPDSQITLGRISDIPSGTYTEEAMTETVWRELRPVFTRFRV